MVGLVSLVRVVQHRHRVLLVRRSISLQRRAQRPPLDVHRCLQACHQPECLLVRVLLLVAQFRHLQVPCPQRGSAFRHLQVSAWLQVLHVLVLAVSVLVLVAVLAVLVFVLVLVAHAPVVLVDSVPVLVAHVLVALVVPAHVLVLVHVPEALAAHAPVVLAAHLAQAALVAVLVPAAVLAALAVHVTDSVVHLARSHVHVVGASSMNCSRSSRSTQTAMLPFQKARSLSSVVGQHRSSLRS